MRNGIEQSLFPSEEKYIIKIRQDLLGEPPVPEPKEQAVQNLFRTLASESAIQGIGVYRTESGSLYLNIIVNSYRDAGAMRRVGDLVEDAEEVFATASGGSGFSHDYIYFDSESIDEIADQFMKNFDNPVSQEEIERNPLAVLRTSSSNSELLGIVMFKD